ncbi:MAG: NTP transferase domain-containing protein, partial [Nitrospirota bacterium]
LAIPGVHSIFVTACDMPFINAILIQHIVSKWDNKWDAMIPIFDAKSQPLFGIYSKKILKDMEREIKYGKGGLREFLKKMNVCYVNEEEIRQIDPGGRSFVNINTMRDFEREIGGEICLV